MVVIIVVVVVVLVIVVVFSDVVLSDVVLASVILMVMMVVVVIVMMYGRSGSDNGEVMMHGSDGGGYDVYRAGVDGTGGVMVGETAVNGGDCSGDCW